MNKIYKGYFCTSRNTDLKCPMCVLQDRHTLLTQIKKVYSKMKIKH